MTTTVSDAPTGEKIISTDRLRKSFRSPSGPVAAVDGVSIEVGRGEIFGFLGPNGAGKTTTLRMLTTLLPIDEGVATVAGFDVALQPKEVRARIGYVSQRGGAYDLATGKENLILQGRLYGGDLDSVTKRTEMLMRILDLAEFADRRVKTYSGGQRRRLDIALGIIHQPAILFLDEPSTGDPQNRANLWDHVHGLRERGTTIFLTTHYLEEADALCDRLVIMDHGQIVIEGTPRHLKRQVSGESVVLNLRDPDRAAADRALATLRAEPFVREITSDGDVVRLYVEDGSAALPQILRLLDGQGVGVRSVQLSEPTLDDVFLRQTGRSLRDAGPLSPEGGSR